MTASHTPAEPQGTIDMTATDSAVLAGCPFCGGARVGDFHHIVSGIPDSWHVECLAEDCGCGTCHHETRAEAIAAWNRRPESADDALLREARDVLANSQAESGYCMCGDPVESHNIGSGHAPVDAHIYMAGQLIERIDAHLARPRPARDEGQKP